MFVMIFDRQQKLLAVYTQEEYKKQRAILTAEMRLEWHKTTKAEVVWCSDVITLNTLKYAFNLHNTIIPLKDIIELL